MKQRESNIFTTLLLLASLCMIAMSSMDMFLPSLPAIGEFFHTSSDTLQLTVTLYMFTIGLGQLFFGPLIDRWGRRKVGGLCLCLYILASTLAMLSPSIHILILARILQATGACSLMIIAFSSLRDITDEHLRMKALSYLSMTTSVSPIVAPMVGAYLESHWGWRTNFACMVMLGVLVGIFMYFRLKNSTVIKSEAMKLSALKKYQLVITNHYFWQYVLCLVAAFVPLITFISVSSYLLMVLLKLSPHAFSFAFGANASMLLFGNFFSLKLRKQLGMTGCLYVGALLMLVGGVLLVGFTLNHYITVLSLMCCVLVSSLGTVIVLPVANAALLSPFQQIPATAAGLSNSLRMSVSAVIAAIVSTFITPHLIAYPLLIVVCALTVFFAAFKGKSLQSTPITIPGTAANS